MNLRNQDTYNIDTLAISVRIIQVATVLHKVLKLQPFVNAFLLSQSNNVVVSMQSSKRGGNKKKKHHSVDEDYDFKQYFGDDDTTLKIN